MRWPILLLVLAFGCSRTSKPSEADAATAAPPAGSSTPPTANVLDAGPGAVFAEGEHTYAGKLGANTNIAMELVRAGEEVHGSYRYVSIGRPIAIAGKVDASGAIALTESVSGRTTGALRLRPSGADLVGEWSDPAGKKVFPVRLSPTRGATPDAGTSLARQAEKCLEDVTCPANEVARLLVASDDARESDSDCFHFLDGAGVARDLRRGRACLERTSADPCDGNSAFLVQAQLATMRIDGLGGPVDVAGARALFATCNDDVTKETVLEHASAKERDPKTPALDVCTGGTTLVFDDCLRWREDSERTRGLLAAKTVAASLDPDGVRLFRAANKAFADYVASRADFVLEVLNGGSIRTAVALLEEQALEKKRADDLVAFAAFTAKSPSEDDATRASKKADAAFTAAMGATSTPAEKRALANTNTTWKAYRDAEVAFYDHVYGATQGHDEVRRALIVKLSTRRVAESPMPPP